MAVRVSVFSSPLIHPHRPTDAHTKPKTYLVNRAKSSAKQEFWKNSFIIPILNKNVFWKLIFYLSINIVLFNHKEVQHFFVILFYKKDFKNFS